MSPNNPVPVVCLARGRSGSGKEGKSGSGNDWAVLLDCCPSTLHAEGRCGRSGSGKDSSEVALAGLLKCHLLGGVDGSSLLDWDSSSRRATASAGGS